MNYDRWYLAKMFLLSTYIVQTFSSLNKNYCNYWYIVTYPNISKHNIFKDISHEMIYFDISMLYVFHVKSIYYNISFHVIYRYFEKYLFNLMIFFMIILWYILIYLEFDISRYIKTRYIANFRDISWYIEYFIDMSRYIWSNLPELLIPSDFWSAI